MYRPGRLQPIALSSVSRLASNGAASVTISGTGGSIAGGGSSVGDGNASCPGFFRFLPAVPLGSLKALTA